MTGRVFPGGTSVSRLSVYPDACTADGLAGGTPHVHLASTEAYLVTGGTGELHTLDTAGHRVTPLAAGSLVWFTPGTIHRAVNHGDLWVVVVMSNAGLPEAGDAVMTFPPSVIADADRYREAVALPVPQRRELAVTNFLRLAADPAALEQFYTQAVALVRPNVAAWREIWRSTVEASARHTGAVLDALEKGDGGHLRESALLSAPQSATDRLGMCGRLRTYDVRDGVTS
ncbi:cupin domain-containing protein [Actinoplanes sichuanensis]|uniref:Cupin domain-containing protein n=1 Tax=Actinoplanes sichuanensis TaxID=512349 RepID=A0ABW4AVI6_9ACTN|nr:cupin domain-containing protein [Actinoplanes sichuanensis]BEL04426.1 cupin domain-containing protein [Actinoplanes sichuanensis]